MNRINLSLFDKIRSLHLGRCSVCKKINQVQKRGSMLVDMIVNKDKKKHWYFHILANAPKSKNVFEKVHKPHRRQGVLSSLFIRNITDVLSTGDVAPEILGYGIEITGVKVSPCCKIVNVYWRLPPNNYSNDETVATFLSIKAPKIRAELISRNVLGCVPQIYFVRDTTNAYVAAFEKAIKEVDLGSDNQASLIPDDAFTTKKHKIFRFDVTKEPKADETIKVNSPKCEEDSSNSPPPPPSDMKCDVFGLNHVALMNKVISSKCKSKPETHVIDITELNTEVDLFSKIPGTTLHGDSEREKLLKQFQIQRKVMMKRKKKETLEHEDNLCASECAESTSNTNFEDYSPEDVFVDEDTRDRF